MIRHYNCRTCHDLLYVTEEDGICPTCDERSSLKAAKKDGAFFVVLDLHKQLNHVIQKNKAQLHKGWTKYPGLEERIPV